MITRSIAAELMQTRKSVLLLGPRQVGKSTLVQSLKPELTIQLADELEFLRYSSKPQALREEIEDSKARTVFIDEVQRIPKLLNTIQSLVDQDKKLKFYLTGSSARKLRSGEANLLPGRVVNFNLGPLVSSELDYKIDTQKVMEFGALPEVYLSKNEKENARILRSYSANYIKEEIKAESLVRNLESFARFFQETLLWVGQFIDLSKMANRSKISRHAIPRYFEILEDTLVGYRIFPFSMESSALDLVKHPKFFFFDNGVYNGLLENFRASADRSGVLAEQLVFSQLLHSSWAKEASLKVSTFRTRSGVEVDFIAEAQGKTYAIEVKNSAEIESSTLDALRFFKKESGAQEASLFVFHMGNAEKKRGDIWVLPWQKGLREMGL